MECALNGGPIEVLVRVRRGERTERWTRLCVCCGGGGTSRDQVVWERGL